ncbi:MAG: DUF3618 domain-containing protein [Microbacteriaceae bacterium]
MSTQTMSTETMSTQTMSTQTMSEVERARTELAFTLDALEDKLNLPKRIRRRMARARARVRLLRDNNPAALAAVVVGVTAAVGAAAYFGVRAVQNR